MALLFFRKQSLVIANGMSKTNGVWQSPGINFDTVLMIYLYMLRRLIKADSSRLLGMTLLLSGWA
jgi:hypothetical protein